MFELVIPVAGKGSRFNTQIPKPLIEVENKPSGQKKTLLEWSLDCLPMDMVKRVTLVTNKANDAAIRRYVEEELRVNGNAWNFVIDEKPQGQAGSALVGLKEVDPRSAVISANCDQFVQPVGRGTGWSPLNNVLTGSYDGLIPTFNGHGPKWSYVSLDDRGQVAWTVEKPAQEPARSQAIVGIFAWHKAENAVQSIEAMMKEDFRVNGEFYTAPSFNWLIRERQNIYPMQCRMKGIGTPEDVAEFADFDI